MLHSPPPTRIADARAAVGDGRDTLARWAAGLAALDGWSHSLAAAVFGVLAATALPPVHLLPALVPAFVGLVWLLDGAGRSRTAFLTGWWFGFGHFAVGLYWIAHALLTDPWRFGWMIPFAVFGLAALMAVFAGLSVWVAWRASVAGLGRILLLAATWTFFEWVRGWFLTGFPWNLIGTVWVVSDSAMQAASVIGVLGLSLVTVLAAALPAAAGYPGTILRRGAPGALAVILVAGLWAAGAARLAEAGIDPTVPDARLRLVQPAIAQGDKWKPEVFERNLARLIALSRRPGTEEVTHVVWPETAAGFFLDLDDARRRQVTAAVPPGGLLLTGTLRTTAASLRREEPFRVWNSLQALDEAGAVVASYDKAYLVPFGEYVPLRRILPIAKITAGDTDFSAGPGPVTLTLPALPSVSPLICYEVIFSGSVVDRRNRPGWLLNVTNDGWFGISSGPYQHFASARLRAVEEGLPLVRAANTGVSGIIDPHGRVVVSLGLGEEGVVDGPLPRALAEPTWFSRHGTWTLFVLMTAVGAAGAATSGRRRTK